MKLLYKLLDDQFPYTKTTHKRACARGIILNDKNEICLLHVNGDDIFGHRDYYETPGGGVNQDETPEEAIIRECKEEIGAITEIIAEIGLVDDYYNLIGRNNLNYYYLLRVKGSCPKALEEYEKQIIENELWVDIDKAIELVDGCKPTPISILVKNRELPIYKLARDIIKNLS